MGLPDDFRHERPGKCAQLFNVLGSFYPEDELDKLVTDPGVGGVLFRPDRKEVVRRQFERVDHLAKIPLLKASNLEEGGAGILTDGTFFGNAIQIAAASDLTCAESYGACCAKEGREAGVGVGNAI